MSFLSLLHFSYFLTFVQHLHACQKAAPIRTMSISDYDDNVSKFSSNSEHDRRCCDEACQRDLNVSRSILLPMSSMSKGRLGKIQFRLDAPNTML